MKAKVSPATEIVQRAQAKYPQNLRSTLAYFGSPPYGKQTVDRRAEDKRLIHMTPQDLAQMAIVDPVGAEAAAKRLAQLDVKASIAPPYNDTYEPE